MIVDERGRLVYNCPILYPKQLEFFKETRTYNGYGGARGGGKSFCIRPKAINLALKFPGINILFVRRTLRELEENHLPYFEKELAGVCKYDKKKYLFKFPNGSRLRFGYVNTDADMDAYQGQSIDAIFIDEATHFTYNMFVKFTECLRLSDTIKEALGQGLTFKPRMYLTANPGGVGHYWFKRLFIDRKYENDENPDDYRFVQSLVFDNQFILENDPAYVKRLEALPEKEKKAMLYGDWDSFEGQFFEEFDEEIHTFDPNEAFTNDDEEKVPFEVMPNWRIYRTRDYGLDMLAALWVALDEEGTFWVYREFGKSNLAVTESGKTLNNLTSPEEVIFSDIAPPDMWNRNRDTGRSAADILQRDCGQRLVKANNDREMGWLMLKELLAINPATNMPYLRISRRCTELIKCLRLIQHDDKNPNDCAKDPHSITHFPDALRYLASSYTYRPGGIVMPNAYRQPSYADFALNMGVYERLDYLDEEKDSGYIDMEDLDEEWW